ncbi:MAG: AMP-binding protein [Alphaproteobacteria bacterium]|nr:AMP-binding protein [Alphaproteobacteria bacterium]MBV9419617.1 AMP-binding protein [Alphaproteobacteria bacterium]
MAALARTAEQKPNAPAITCEGVTYSWSELHKRTNRMARGMAKHGVKHGQFVTIALPNSIAFVEACYAAWKLGAIPQPVSSRLPLAELNAIAELAETPIIVSDVPFDAVKPIVSSIELIQGSDDESDLPDVVSPAWKAPTSGGSTGRPKLIVSGQPGLVDGVGAAFWRIGKDDVMLMPGPMYHNGPFITVFSGMQIGAPVVLMPKFDAEGVLREVERNKATWVYLVPTMMGRIWRLPEEVRTKYDVSSLKTVWHLAAPCPAWLKDEWIKWLGGEVIWELYGGTEGLASTILSGTEWLAHRGSVGRVQAGGVMKAFGPDGNELPVGETGEIYMKRDVGMPASYRYVGATPRTLKDGWESIGDIGWFDADGYLYLADRRTDMILVGGANVYPAEIEAALEEHPLVASSAVIGIPDDDLGNKVHAIIQPRPGLDLEDLQKHMAEKLVVYKRPRTYELVTENVRDDAGKVRRTALRDERIAKMKAGG